MNDYQIGSEWRKWDLHVHSPYSKGYQGSWVDFTAQIKLAQCDVIGINDYFSIEGYKKIQEEIKTGSTDVGEKILFPVVEMRMTDTVQNKHTQTCGVTHFNFHIIFNNDHNVLNIEDIELFIKSLVSDKTTIGTDYNNKDKLADKKVSFDDTLNKLESDKKFKDNYLIWLPYDEYGGIDEINPSSDGWIKSNFIKSSHILGSSRPSQISFFQWKSPLKKDGEPRFSQHQFKEWFNSKKPCIKGSDSHASSYPIGKLQNEKSKPTEKYCWIKVDPTFQGLKQILNEPEDRVFIGTIPDSVHRINQNPTRVIKSISANKIEGSKIDEEWFNFKILLNSGLVAIIGNKGSGKSALADIIGLLGNTKRHEKFSFLTKDKFCSTKRGKSMHFQAKLIWNDHKEISISSLSANHDPDRQERVKYIPQSYLEDICSEVGFNEGGAFYSELKEVIFSRVQEADRLGFDNLDSLLRHRDKEVENRIDQLISEIKALNREISELEEKISPEHKREVQAALKAKEIELEAHDGDSIKPKEVAEPNEEKDKESQSDQQQLEKKKLKLNEIDKDIQVCKQKNVELAQNESEIYKVKKQVDNIKRYVDENVQSMSQEFSDLGIKISDIVSLRIDDEKLDERLKLIDRSREGVEVSLNKSLENSLTWHRERLDADIQNLNKKLSEPQKKYQAYLENLAKWQARRDEIVGNDNQVGSTSYLKDQIKKIETIFPSKKKSLEGTRFRKSLEIFKEKLILRDHYSKYYGSVQEYLDSYPIKSIQNLNITFDVSISEGGFSDRFFGYINQGRTGSFYGSLEGTEKITSLIEARNFDSAYEIGRFLRSVTGALTSSGKSVISQLKKGVSPEELYDLIFSLEYLNPIYNLKWDGKELDQLSPGERGNLLLIFYLILDRNDIPLIIDQPEENLDNQTVFNTLVPCVKDAKNRRQIILVTHNPNLAVVCDADQVIHSKIHKNQKNKVEYISGSIENTEINAKIMDVLEGTRPAFEKRDAKYFD